MQIHGFNKLTLLDYPGHIACTVFTGHCNMRCPFCQNASLVLFPETQPAIPEEEFFSFLKKRHGILEGVCVTGGEPTLSTDLPDFLAKIHELGYLIKLDTNGTNPAILTQLITDKLVDYIAMDIKSSLSGYPAAVGIPGFSTAAIEESVALLLQNTVPYEFRTTVVRELHSKQEFLDIANWIKGARAYYLQTFQDSGELISRFCPGTAPTPILTGYTKKELEDFVALLAPYVQTIGLRGID